MHKTEDVCGVKLFIVRSGLGESNSKPGRSSIRSISRFFPWDEAIVGQIVIFSLVKANCLERLWIENQLYSD